MFSNVIILLGKFRFMGGSSYKNTLESNGKRENKIVLYGEIFYVASSSEIYRPFMYGF